MQRFSNTVNRGKIFRPSGAWPTPRCTITWGSAPLKEEPSNSIRPVRGRNKPERVFNVVVLPAPLAPSKVTNSPFSMEKETPFKACMAPSCTSLTLSIAPPRPAPQVRFNDAWISAHLVGMSFGDLFPVIENVNSVRNAHHHAHVVLNKQHGLDVTSDEIFE